MPQLVQSVYQPALFDTLGNEVSPGLEYLAVNYTGLIPVLIAGAQEQQSVIDSLEQSIADQAAAMASVMDQLDNLQDQINNCCTGGQGFKNNQSGGNDGMEQDKSTLHGNILNQNTPNPFRSQTTISYSLETGGKVLLNVYDKTGKILTTLEESEQQSGTYRYEWDASGLPAGLYHYALYVDGELLVKKAIKLAD